MGRQIQSYEITGEYKVKEIDQGPRSNLEDLRCYEILLGMDGRKMVLERFPCGKKTYKKR